jgi:hypothetical protein
MGLLKRIYTEDNTGAYAEYWKVTEISSNWLTNRVEITISGFFDQSARLGGRNPLLKKVIIAENTDARDYFSPTSMQPDGVDIIRNAYIYTKRVDRDFTDAEDSL